MKKTFLLSMLGLAAMGAHAQSSVTLYEPSSSRSQVTGAVGIVQRF